MNSRVKKATVFKVGLVGLAALGAIAGIPGAASAAQYPACYANTDCFYYSGGLTGSLTAFNDGHMDDMYPIRFLSGGAGQGQYVANNSHSMLNNWSNELVRVCYSAYGGGPCDNFSPFVGRNFIPSLVNNNRSFYNES